MAQLKRGCSPSPDCNTEEEEEERRDNTTRTVGTEARLNLHRVFSYAYLHRPCHAKWHIRPQSNLYSAATSIKQPVIKAPKLLSVMYCTQGCHKVLKSLYC